MITQEFTTQEHDILIEVATMGTARAAGSIAQMINHKVDVKVPELKLIALEHASDQMGEPEQTMSVVIVKIEGDASGVILLLMTPKDAARLTSGIAAGQAESALEEIVNIFAGASLGALARFLDLQLRQSIPGSATDMLRAIINEGMSELGVKNDNVLLLSMDFKVADLETSGKLYFIFDATSTQKILKNCKEQIEHNHAASS